MKIAVLQQYAPVTYNRHTELPGLDELKKNSERSVSRCLELIEEAAKNGADFCVTIETVNAYIALRDTRFKYTEALDGEVVKRFSEAAKKHKMHIVYRVTKIMEIFREKTGGGGFLSVTAHIDIVVFI